MTVNIKRLCKITASKNMTVNVKGLGKITASKEVLNELVIAFSHSATFYMLDNWFKLAEREESRSNAIHDKLSKVGYYDNLQQSFLSPYVWTGNTKEMPQRCNTIKEKKDVYKNHAAAFGSAAAVERNEI